MTNARTELVDPPVYSLDKFTRSFDLYEVGIYKHEKHIGASVYSFFFFWRLFINRIFVCFSFSFARWKLKWLEKDGEHLWNLNIGETE